jgi:PKD repeat protein
VTASHTYTAAGVYTVTLTLTDAGNSNLSGSSTFQYVVIFDASAGFTTGGGWFNSPAGAYAANPALTGKANFGFNAKYKSGSNVPTGQTEFQFPAGNLSFNPSSYDWLVLNGSQAQFQGSGTINGSGNYGFLVTVTDNDASSSGPDAIRIQIWDKNNNNSVVYDTQPGAVITAAPTTFLGGGDIQVHASSAKMETVVGVTGGTTTSGTPQPAPLPGSSDSSNPVAPVVSSTPAALASNVSPNAGSWLTFEANVLDYLERDLDQWEAEMTQELSSLVQTIDQLLADWAQMTLDSFGANPQHKG